MWLMRKNIRVKELLRKERDRYGSRRLNICQSGVRMNEGWEDASLKKNN